MTTKNIKYFQNSNEGLSNLIKITNNFNKTVLICNNNSFITSNYKSPILQKYSIKGFIRCLNNRSLNISAIKHIIIDDPNYIYDQSTGNLYKATLATFFYLQEQFKILIEIHILKYNNSIEIGQTLSFNYTEITTTRETDKFFVEEKITENYLNKRIVEFFKLKRNPTRFSKLVVICPFKNSAIKNSRSLRNSLIKNFTYDTFEQTFDIVCLVDYNQNVNKLFILKSNLTSNLIIFITLPVINKKVINCDAFYKLLDTNTNIDWVFVKSTKMFNAPNFTLYTSKEWALISCLNYENIHIFTSNKQVLLKESCEFECSIVIKLQKIEDGTVVTIINNIMAILRAMDHPRIIEEQIKSVLYKLFEERDDIFSRYIKEMLQFNILKENKLGIYSCNNEAIFSILLEKEEGLGVIRRMIEIFKTEDLKITYIKTGDIINELFSSTIKQITNKINKTTYKKINKVIPKIGFLMLFEVNFNNSMLPLLKTGQPWLKSLLDKLFDKVKTNVIISLKLLKFNGEIKTIDYKDNINIKILVKNQSYGMFIYYILKIVASLNVRKNLFSQGISRFIINKRQDQPLRIDKVYKDGAILTICIPICSIQSIRGYLLFSIKNESESFGKYYCFELTTRYKNDKTKINIEIENHTLRNHSKIKLIILDLKGSILLDAEEKLTQKSSEIIKKPKVEQKTEVIRSVLDFFNKYKYNK